MKNENIDIDNLSLSDIEELYSSILDSDDDTHLVDCCCNSGRYDVSMASSLNSAWCVRWCGRNGSSCRGWFTNVNGPQFCSNRC